MQLTGLSGDLSTPFAVDLNRIAGLFEGPIGLAVSGGGDSMALLHIASEWARSAGRSLIAITVDHGLRPEAAEEARLVGRVCSKLGVPHQIDRWGEPDPSQAKARRARHALIARAARQHDCSVILTGHTADDDIETFLMRARRGSGWFGLAGMGRVSLSPAWPEGRGVFIGRPFLNTKRAELRAVLKTRGACWVEDPTNDNPAYERVRWRQGLSRDSDLSERIGAVIADFKRLRRLQARAVASVLEDYVIANPDGSLYLDPVEVSPAHLERVVGWLVQLASGSDSQPKAERLETLCRVIADGGPKTGRTLGGARIVKAGRAYSRPGSILFFRETGSMETFEEDQDRQVWDGRFVRVPDAGEIRPEGPRLVPTLPKGSGWQALASCRLADVIYALNAY